MDFVANRFYRLNKYLLWSLCLWPGQTSRYTRSLRVIMDVLLVHCVTVQLMVFTTREFSLDLLLDILPLATIDAMFVLKYNLLLFNGKDIKELIETIRIEWMTVKCNEEQQILITYNKNARFFVVCIAHAMYFAVLLFFMAGFMSDILDIVVPLNESRSRQLPHVVEYFVDQEKYFYSLLLLMGTTVFIGATTVLCSESLCILFVAHICGMLRITCYRIKNICFVPTSRYSAHQNDMTTFRRIISAIVIYQKAIEFADLFASTFMSSYFALLSLGVLASTMHLFRLSQAFIFGSSIDQIGHSVFLVIGLFFYMFACNYVGQTVIDHHAAVFGKLCDLQWYTAPLQFQKLLLLFLQRTIKNYMLVPGGVFVASFKGFTALLNMSFSYFMVIYSRG